MLALHISGAHRSDSTDADALDGLADNIVESFAAEEPGADLMALPRDGAENFRDRPTYRGSAQCAHFFATATRTRMRLWSRSRGMEIAGLLSVLGLIQSDHQGGDAIFAPHAPFGKNRPHP